MNYDILENSTSEEKEYKNNWKSIIIYSSVMITLGVGIGFIVTAINNDFVYVEIITAIFGVLSMLFMMARIRGRDSENYKKNKSIVEDKKTMDYKNWLRMQLSMLAVGVFMLLLSYIFFLIFRK